MQRLTTNDLGHLLSAQPKPCITAYLPVERLKNAAEGRGAMKKSLGEAQRLITASEGAHKARFLIEPLKDVIMTIGRPPPDGTRTLALFRSFTTAAFHTSPLSTKELTVVADTFHLKPFLHALQGLDRYFVVNLSQKSATLFSATENSMKPRAQYQAEYGEKPARERRENVIKLFEREGSRVTTFRPRSRVMRFLREVEERVWEHVREESCPLILAGTSFLHQLYRSVNRYGNLSEEGIHSAFGAADIPALHRASYRVAERFFTLRALEIADKFYSKRRVGLAGDDLAEVAMAATRSRVSDLLVCRESHLWGVLDRSTGRIELRESQKDSRDDDVLDDIAQEVILRRGRVYTLEPSMMPVHSPVVALYRW